MPPRPGARICAAIRSRHDDESPTSQGRPPSRARGKAIGGAAVTDDAMLAVALHLRGQEMSLRDIAARARYRHRQEEGPAPITGHVMRMLREHDEKAAAADVNLIAR